MRFRGKDLLERRSFPRTPISKNFQHMSAIQPSSARNAAWRRYPAILEKRSTAPFREDSDLRNPGVSDILHTLGSIGDSPLNADR
jgi:hypothetical protein